MRSIVYTAGFFLFLYSLLATSVSYFAANSPFYGYEFFWSLPILFFIGLLVRERKFIFKYSPSVLLDNLDFFAVLAALLALRFYFLEHVSIWLDEDFQAVAAWKSYPVAAGVAQHQPPGDFVFTSMGLLVSNYSVWGLRLHAALFSSLAGATLYALAKKFSASRTVALLCVLFYSLHHVVFRYGFEARPISYGLFLELLFFAAVYTECRVIAQKDQPPQPWSASLSAIAFLYLCSVGLQPGFIVVLTIGFFALLSVFRREYLIVFLRLALGLLCFLPLQLAIFLNAPPRFTRGFSVIGFFDEIRWENFNFLYKFLMPVGYVSVAGVLLYFLWSAFRRKKPELLLLFLFYIAIFFPLTLIPFFRSHISWHLNHYYLISILPPLFLLFSALWGATKVGRLRWALPSAIIPVVLFAGFAPFYQFVNVGRDLELERQDLKGAYSEIRKNALNSDLTLSFCLSEGSCPDRAIGKKLYRLPPPSNADEPSVAIYAHALRATPQPQNIFFVHNEPWSQGVTGLKHLFSSPNLASIYKVSSNENLALAVIDFFEGPVRAGLADNKMYSEAVAYLVASYDYLGDEKSKLHYLNLYKKMALPEGQNAYLNELLRPPGE